MHSVMLQKHQSLKGQASCYMKETQNTKSFTKSQGQSMFKTLNFPATSSLLW